MLERTIAPSHARCLLMSQPLSRRSARFYSPHRQSGPVGCFVVLLGFITPRFVDRDVLPTLGFFVLPTTTIDDASAPGARESSRTGSGVSVTFCRPVG